MSQKNQSAKLNKPTTESAMLPTLIMWERTPLDGFASSIPQKQLLDCFKEKHRDFNLVVIRSNKTPVSIQGKDKHKIFIQPRETKWLSISDVPQASRLEMLGTLLAGIESDNRYYSLETEDPELLAAFSMFAFSLYPGRLVRFINRDDLDKRRLHISQLYSLSDISSNIRYKRDNKLRKKSGSDAYGEIENEQKKEIDIIAALEIPPHLLLLGETGSL